MIICPNCQKQLPDGANFCDGCGTQFHQAVICPKCGNQTPANLGYCQACGVQFAAPTAPAAPAAEQKGFNLDAIKNLPKKTLGLIGGAAAAVVALIIIIAIIAGSGMPNYAIYSKGLDLYYRDLGSKSAIELDDARSAFLSVDGKTLFIQDEDGDLVYRNINKKNSETKKWLSMEDVDEWMISENCKIITYIKGGSLYQKKLGAETQTKIASDVSAFTTTPNGGKILYVTDESDIYYVSKVKEGNAGKKVVSAVDEGSLRFISDDLKTICYIKEDSLYTAVAGKEPKKIASDVYSARVFDLKNMYYVTEEEVKEGEDVVDTEKSLYFYNGKTSTALAEDIYNSSELTNKESKAYVYTTVEEKSEKSTTCAYYVAVDGKTNLLHEYTVSYNDNGERDDFESIDGFAFTENGKKLYYLVKNNSAKTEPDAEPATGDLKEVSVGKKLGTPKTVDSDVYELSSDTTVLSKPVYTKEYKTDSESGKTSFDLYMNKKLVCTDAEDFEYSEAAKGFIIETDGSLKFYKSKLVTISDDFDSECQLSILPSGDILFTKDVSEKTGKGDLYRFTGKKAKLIDTDVSYIMGAAVISEQYEDNAHLYLYCPGVPSAENVEIDEY